jgi:hypothetical protein
VNVLKLADIDTTIYKSHSFRHASTSKAHRSGVKVSTIYENAGWSDKSKIFYKFYNKPLPNNNQTDSFGKTVLNYK